jgi:SAM-dependent methyltransferase
MNNGESFGKEMCGELRGRGYPVLYDIFDHQAQFMSGYDWEEKGVLDLGAWDGRHSEVAIRLGARCATVVEGRAENLKDAHPARPEKVRFVVGDIRKLDELLPVHIRWDVGLIFGVLYHLDNPVRFLKQALPRMREAVFIWTHVADTIDLECEGYAGKRYEDPGRSGNDAIEPLTAFWFAGDELVRCLGENGFEVVRMVNMPTPRHPAPAVCVWAERSKDQRGDAEIKSGERGENPLREEQKRRAEEILFEGEV